jgi:hypothetical protein
VNLLIDRCMCGAQRVGTTLQLMNFPSDRQRAMLVKRHADIAAVFTQQDRQAIGAAVSELLSCYRNGVRMDEDAKKVTTKYVAELRDLPTWAIIRACDAMRLGVADQSPDHPPSTIKIRQLAESYVTTMRREAVSISEILKAEKMKPEVPPEVRKEVGRRFGELAKEMLARVERDGGGKLPPLPKTEAQKSAERFYVQREPVHDAWAEAEAEKPKASADPSQQTFA